LLLHDVNIESNINTIQIRRSRRPRGSAGTVQSRFIQPKRLVSYSQGALVAIWSAERSVPLTKIQRAIDERTLTVGPQVLCERLIEVYYRVRGSWYIEDI
jgi:hypothetical protein